MDARTHPVMLGQDSDKWLVIDERGTKPGIAVPIPGTLEPAGATAQSMRACIVLTTPASPALASQRISPEVPGAASSQCAAATPRRRREEPKNSE
jgi:hypothetical protein